MWKGVSKFLVICITAVAGGCASGTDGAASRDAAAERRQYLDSVRQSKAEKLDSMKAEKALMENQAHSAGEDMEFHRGASGLEGYYTLKGLQGSTAAEITPRVNADGTYTVSVVVPTSLKPYAFLVDGETLIKNGSTGFVGAGDKMVLSLREAEVDSLSARLTANPEAKLTVKGYGGERVCRLSTVQIEGIHRAPKLGQAVRRIQQLEVLIPEMEREIEALNHVKY
ncbi:MAG: hypothetical protein K2M79_06720 [Muribaculaceae bacterium]|nr:hypothetical protein [Muribaculaceae bacterium]